MEIKGVNNWPVNYYHGCGYNLSSSNMTVCGEAVHGLLCSSVTEGRSGPAIKGLLMWLISGLRGHKPQPATEIRALSPYLLYTAHLLAC